MQSIQPEFFTEPLIKYTRPCAYDFAPYGTQRVVRIDDNVIERWIQMGVDADDPKWERLGAVLERIAGDSHDFEDFCQTYEELMGK
jgi:hypothetical protein